MTIDINLIPPELRKKKKTGVASVLFIPLEVLIGSAGGLLFLLVMVHFSLLFLNINKLSEHKKLKAKLESILPAQANVQVVIDELKGFQDRQKAIVEALGSDKRMNWSQKLNILSDSLPKGVWLKRIALNEEMFLIEGSAISRQKEEMINVHSLTANLKKEKVFLQDLLDLEVGNIQREKIKKIEIANFIITAQLDKDE